MIHMRRGPFQHSSKQTGKGTGTPSLSLELSPCETSLDLNLLVCKMRAGLKVSGEISDPKKRMTENTTKSEKLCNLKSTSLPPVGNN